MKISKFGHACLLIEDGKARILVDPGAYSNGFEEMSGLSAVLITHSHGDHMVPENLQNLQKHNPKMVVYTDKASAKELMKVAPELKAKAVHDGDELVVDGVTVKVEGSEHAEIHSSMPRIPNVGYLIAGRFFYPGDNFTKPAEQVEVLGLPAGAPWLKISEVIDYALAVKPKVAIPVHDAVLALPEMNSGIVSKFTEPAGIELRVVPNGESTEV